jgi:hypothetical protein
MEIVLTFQRKDNVDIRLNLHRLILYGRWLVIPQTNGIDGSHRQKWWTGEHFYLAHTAISAHNYLQFYRTLYAVPTCNRGISRFYAMFQLGAHYFSPRMNPARRMLVRYRRRTARNHAGGNCNTKDATHFPSKHDVSLLFEHLLGLNNIFCKVSSPTWAETPMLTVSTTH